MTFEDLVSQWQRGRMQEQKRHLLARLTGPERLWFECCRDLARRGLAPGSLPDLEPILGSLSHRQAQVARAHLECALLAASRQWTSDTVETSALRELHARLFPTLPDHLPFAFLRDLSGELLGRRREAPTGAQRTVLFPLVQSSGGMPTGNLAVFVLEALDGEGQVFLDPRQAFVLLDESFAAVFRHARDILRQHLGCLPRGDVRVRIEPFRHEQARYEELTGNSAGGALALGLWSLWTNTRLEAGIVASFALTPQDRLEPDGNCHVVGGVTTKASEIAEILCPLVKDKGGEGTFLVADGLRDALQGRVEQMRPLRLEAAATLRQAVEIASGRLGELLAYLDALVAEANRVPAYYPRDARMERVRVSVRVSSERQHFDRLAAQEREQARRQGFAEEGDGLRVYRHRLGGDGAEQEKENQPRVEVLDWDRQVRDRIRRGVVVGDPGLGKTWLLKWEAARHAAEAARRLRETGDLAGVVLPIYRPQTDVAAALRTLEERRKHVAGAPPPSLPEAVVESLLRWQLPAPPGGTSRPLSERVLELLRSRLGTEHGLLLLDAFDEVPDERRPLLRGSLGEWVRGNPGARVLFTSRVVGYEQPWPIAERSETEREMELLPFDDAQMGAFVDAFFAGDPPAARELRELLRRAVQLRGMAQAPLLLGFLCAWYREERHKPERQRRDVSRLRRTDLYKAVLERLLSGQWKDPPRSLGKGKVAEKLELLEPLAFRLFASGKEQFSLRDVRQEMRAAYAELYPGRPLSNTEVTERIREWSEEDGLLIEAGAGDDAPYLFLHLTFQEFLTARYLAARINPAGWEKAALPAEGQEKGLPVKEFLDRKAWLPAWQEVIVLLAGNLNDAAPLLEMLADEGKDDLLRHRLALAALCLPEIEELMQER
jgi:hypothetical protein